MTTILNPSPPKKPGSKEIINEFIKSPLNRCTIDAEPTGRSASSIYVSLRKYLSTHKGLHISVSIQEGQITLSKE